MGQFADWGRSIKVFGTRIVMEDVAGTACGKDGIHDPGTDS